LVSASLYLLVIEREAVLAFAAGGAPEAEDAPEETAPRVERVSVVAMASVAREIEQIVLVRGRTEAARQVEVRAETSGTIISEPLRRGAMVEEGALLCSIDPGTRTISLAEAEARLLQAKAQVPEAEARLNEAEINLNAAANLAEDGFASETRLASAEASRSSALAGLEAAIAGVQSAEASIAAVNKDIERLEVRAPFAGLLETDTAELGALLQPGNVCATIIQLDPIKLVGFVPETEIDKVSLGATAGARLATGREVLGEVVFLSRSADEMTRTFRIEVEVPNPDLSIRDGQTAEIAIQSEGLPAHLIPQSALTLNDMGTLGVRVVGPGDVTGFLPVDILRDTTKGIYVAGLGQEANVIVVGQEFVTEGVPVAPTYREEATQ
jgi:multidrug efflux system membrane fusion protein